MQATISPSRTLQERLEDGAQLLFQREQQGDTGPDYQRWLERWLRLLDEYKAQPA